MITVVKDGVDNIAHALDEILSHLIIHLKIILAFILHDHAAAFHLRYLVDDRLYLLFIAVLEHVGITVQEQLHHRQGRCFTGSLDKQVVNTSNLGAVASGLVIHNAQCAVGKAVHTVGLVHEIERSTADLHLLDIVHLLTLDNGK